MPAERHSVDSPRAPKAADPFTLNVIQEALAATADEMFAVLKKTAMSPIIYEVLDVGTGVTDAQGDLVASGAGIPGFVGALDKTIKRLLEIVRPDEIEPGDIFVTNDPYYGGVTHLNDVVLAMPVFAGGALVAWVANIAHWNDVGGAVPGSMPVDARDIHAEGLRLPAIKLIERGRAIEPVMKILAANSRLPDFVRGDLWAAVASVRRGAERVERLVAAYGSDAFVEAIADCHDYAERRARAGLARLPKGRLALEEPMDDGSVWRAAIDSPRTCLSSISGKRRTSAPIPSTRAATAR
jgi:N-methylhydantoinase B